MLFEAQDLTKAEIRQGQDELMKEKNVEAAIQAIPEIKDLPTNLQVPTHQQIKDAKDYDSGVRVGCMRTIFKQVGQTWNDLGKQGSDLNMMLSAPIFRHKEDPEYEELKELHGSIGVSLVNDDTEEAMLEIVSKYEATDTTLLDIQKLLLLGVLYCKGSRIGKSNLLYPLIIRDTIERQLLSPLMLREQSCLEAT